MDEMEIKATPGYSELSKAIQTQNELIEKNHKDIIDKIDAQTKLQQEHNIIAHEHYLLAKCFKDGTNKHRERALYITMIFAVTALTADYFIKGDKSHIYTVIKMLMGL